jgi:hypothetical protein
LFTEHREQPEKLATASRAKTQRQRADVLVSPGGRLHAGQFAAAGAICHSRA